jgi:hypothetical protein
MFRRVKAILFATLILVAHVAAVTPVPSADGQFWDIQDTSSWAQDSGGIATGGRSNPFNGFGYLKLQVRLAGGTRLLRNHYLTGFGLAYDGVDRFDSITPVLHEGIVAARLWLRKTRTTCAISTRSRTPRTGTVSLKWRGAGPQGRLTMAGESR